MKTNPNLSIIAGLFAVFLVFIFGLCWWTLKSVNLANIPIAINFRHYYYLNFAPKLGLGLEKLPFEIISIQRFTDFDGESYAYSMLGHYDSVDFDKQILYIKTKNGQLYGFKFFTEYETDLIYSERINDKNVQRFYTNDPFNNQDIILAQWSDKRTLTEILQSAIHDPQKLVNLNNKATDFQLISKL